MNENEIKLKQIVANILKIEINDITSQTSSKDIEAWDSINICQRSKQDVEED